MPATGPPRPSLLVLLSVVERRTAELAAAALSPLGLTSRHLGALGHLRHEPGLSVSELARRAHVTPQSMHATVSDLERDELVQRTGSGRGRRAGLRVTEAGEATLERGLAAIGLLDDDVRSRLGTDGYDALVGGLLRVLADDEAPRPAP